MQKRILCLLMSVLMLALCGCNTAVSDNVIGDTSSLNTSSKNNTSSNIKKTELSLACSVTDSFCPYSAKTMLNRQLATLMYDSLVLLDDDYTPINILADEITVSGTTAVVTIKNVLFTDGKTLTAHDVAYCAKKAMKSNTRYAYALKNVSSVSEISQNKVQFNLKAYDPFFKNQLDFPIYEAGTETKISSDNIAIPPIGSGRYYISKDKSSLKLNESYHGKKGSVKQIKLVDTPDDDALTHNLEVENITYYYTDLSDSSISQIRGHYTKVNLNNLVFLGANMKTGLMKYYEMRQTVSAAIDRNTICDTAYYQNAEPATGLFNPKWIQKQSVSQSLSQKPDENIYLELLKRIGYNKKNDKGYYENSDGETLTLKIVNYKENKWRKSACSLIQTQLKNIGIKAQIVNLDWKEYSTALKNKDFDLYLAEVKIGNNMDVTQLLTKGGTVAYGVNYTSGSQSQSAALSSSDYSSSSDVASSSVPSDSTSSVPQSAKVNVSSGDTAEAVRKFYQSKADLNDIVTAFSYEMPIIPICYRQGILSYASGISGVNPSYSDIYMGIEDIN